jgi:malonyl-CoA O-methyltransferase
MINKQVMRRHFSQNAATYDEYASVQKRMAKELICLLNQAKLTRDNRLRILDIGCGTGYLTRMLCETYPKARITAVDIAPGMIEQSKKRLITPNVTFRCEDFEEAVILHQYDLIISNAAFQWFNSLPRTLNKLYPALSGCGLLGFSTFGKGTFTELHQAYGKAQKEAGVKTFSGPGQAFYSLQELLALCREAAGSENPFIHGKEYFSCEYFASVRKFLESVKKTGANNSNRTGGINPAITKQMIRIYEDEYQAEERIKATYHSMFVVVQKIAGSMEASDE